MRLAPEVESGKQQEQAVFPSSKIWYSTSHQEGSIVCRYLQHQGGTHILYERRMCLCSTCTKEEPVIHNPHVPLFRDPPSRKRQRRILFKAHRPELPMTGGGRVNTISSQGKEPRVISDCNVLKWQQETWMEEDPREAILKYAQVADKDPKFIAPAYSQTQPKTIFAKSTLLFSTTISLYSVEPSYHGIL